MDDAGRWEPDYGVLLQQLRALELSEVGMIEHVGSTSVRGLVAKDVIDVQIRVPGLDAEDVISQFSAAGFRHRPEEWNNIETTRLGPYQKLVFAPPAEARRANVHVRPSDSPGARDTLLYRDYLRASEESRTSWGRFKRSIVFQNRDIDLATYGQAKQPAWKLLMPQADEWARTNEWSMQPMLPWSSI